ncbi:hypothetical protein BDQ17DRAFT_807204 [Cyathus striatus]|nr:hypothetical protein BDQ17DRAFT_807204 [Cyathus striatus]
MTSFDTMKWANKVRTSYGAYKLFSSSDLERLKRGELVNYLRSWNIFLNELPYLPSFVRYLVSHLFVLTFQTYLDISDGKRLMLKLCFATAIAWTVFTMPRLRMGKWYGHDPLKGGSVTLLTSVFAQDKFWQLLIGCFLLEGLGAPVYRILNDEQKKVHPGLLESTTGYHFLAFFLGAGLFSTLISHIATTKLVYPRMIRNIMNARNQPRVETWKQALNAPPRMGFLSLKDSATKIKPVYGFSGALYACAMLTMLTYPDSQLSLYVPPKHPVNLETVGCAVLIFDIVGALRGWSMLNHWAHLGGAVFGLVYYYVGTDVWYMARRKWSGMLAYRRT